MADKQATGAAEAPPISASALSLLFLQGGGHANAALDFWSSAARKFKSQKSSGVSGRCAAAAAPAAVAATTTTRTAAASRRRVVITATGCGDGNDAANNGCTNQNGNDQVGSAADSSRHRISRGTDPGALWRAGSRSRRFRSGQAGAFDLRPLSNSAEHPRNEHARHGERHFDPLGSRPACRQCLGRRQDARKAARGQSNMRNGAEIVGSSLGFC